MYPVPRLTHGDFLPHPLHRLLTAFPQPSHRVPSPVDTPERASAAQRGIGPAPTPGPRQDAQGRTSSVPAAMPAHDPGPGDPICPLQP